MRKRTTARLALGVTAALFGLLIAPAITASAASAAPVNSVGAYVCTGGDVPAGTYNSILVSGLCYMRSGTIVVRGNLTVGRGALLDAGANPGDPPSGPVVTATVLVRGNVFVGKGAVLVLGCSPNLLGICSRGLTFDRIGGNLTANDALANVIHGTTVGGNVTVFGGGGGAAGGASSGACFNTAAFPVPAPWSEDPALANAVPQYTDIEDSSVRGDLTISGLQTCWLGAINVQVGGSLTTNNDVTSDPDGMEIVNNLMGGNIACLNNDPAVQYGDTNLSPNVVAGSATGQCGFNVVKPNPAASPGPPPVTAGPPEHITVSTQSLQTYHGTHTATNVESLPPVTTESKYIITADINSIVLAGTGLTGSGTVSASNPPPGGPGEAVLSTVYPNGSKSFIAYDGCSCSFGGKTGTVLIRFYGTTQPNGFTFGTFLIDSGGTAAGGLSSLAGWGTFSSAGQPAGTWSLVEHLRIT